MSMTSLQPALPHDPATINDCSKGGVSVIVPVFNEAAHLDELLQAIQASPVKKRCV